VLVLVVLLVLILILASAFRVIRGNLPSFPSSILATQPRTKDDDEEEYDEEDDDDDNENETLARYKPWAFLPLRLLGVRPALTRRCAGFQYKGSSQGTIRTLISITTRAKGTPILTKSINWYRPGASTNMFTGDEIGVINAVDAARATIMANG
jgi:hypothetical protein